MNKLMKRSIHLLIAATAALSAAGCVTNSGSDFALRTREHLEFHTLAWTDSFDELHRILDRHILDANYRDPDSY